ncbi:MAG: carboxypeptidase regulatory-like domain-containing protein [Acidobacteria bacterium]|nr:carboxypeptidase regulatory-like domain-containing protein [Acidobacteriota bacterium]
MLRGTVVAADTGAPVRRAVVRVMAPEAQDNRVTHTDDQGRFEIRELAGGRYSINVSKSGYVTLNYGQRRPGERGTPVEIAPGQTLERLTVGLPRGGVIAGRVVDEMGEPLAEAQVQVLRSQFMPGGRRMLPAGRGDMTDDQGAFRIYGLAPGDYVVSASVRNTTGMMMMPNQRAAPDVEQGFAPTYFPGTPSLSDAERVSVGVGQEVTGVTFGMTPTRVSRISGRVVGGKPGDDGFVMVMPEDGATTGGMGASGGMVRADGSFEVSGVPPGRYTLRVQPRGPDAEMLVGTVTLTVAGTDLSNVVIAMQKPGSVTGRIEFEGGPPAGIRPGQFRVQPVALDPIASQSFLMGPPRTADDYTFVVRGASGPVLFRVGGAPGWYVKSVRYGGEDITDSPVVLAAGTDFPGVRILLTQTASSVSGVVRDDRGNAVVDATVVVFPADDTKWTFSSRFIRTGRPDTEGRFELKGLPANTGYRVIALQGMEDMQAYDPEFLSSVRDRAESLALADGEAKSLNVRLRQ